MATSLILSNRAQDARAAMTALIDSRALPIREGEPGYAAEIAKLAWAIADAMNIELTQRAREETRSPR